MRVLIFSLCIACLIPLVGCGKKHIASPQGYPARTKAKPRTSSTYTVWGKNYKTLASSEDFVQYGKASWYGKKFHGRKTANGERYDMYGMTAAHKNLPFGTILRVTNMQNKRSVIVRVNDRGPFVEGRIVDLTHTAAQKLGMLGPGVVPVKLEAVGGPSHSTVASSKKSKSGTYYVQIGSFGDKFNAQTLKQKIVREGRSCRLYQDVSSSIWKVHVGPYLTYTAAERAKRALANKFSGAFIFAGK
ncbi:septal ring lytic transglycosylase RlpA family protein [Halodesulfovibrio marinisediminis]|uniref:Probable endolytic peptidoglycan transglycosylase RlpA n=1 Tax=Halodesulfovibrio marinisediminis DSM 17456 TaxID=1121457 RepID=A0A1N6FBB1_9BACT|nr:septal ring lytic transglycosylase RlpA family protein [Halodesulfovibrio marinisediminis]SIN92581.1 rare lipoprotein A [Halodesulfovibrio marinisediminis DSM 17456]